MITSECPTATVIGKLTPLFRIKDQYGNVALLADGQFFSLRNETRLLDRSGQPLLIVRKKLLSLFESFTVFDANERVLFRAEGKFSPFKPKFTVWFTDALTNQPVQLEIVGNFMDWRAEIKLVSTGAVIGRLRRDFSDLPNLFMGRDTYVVEVAPNVDIAMMVALGIIYDERSRESKGKGNRF